MMGLGGKCEKGHERAFLIHSEGISVYWCRVCRPEGPTREELDELLRPRSFEELFQDIGSKLAGGRER